MWLFNPPCSGCYCVVTSLILTAGSDLYNLEEDLCFCEKLLWGYLQPSNTQLGLYSEKEMSYDLKQTIVKSFYIKLGLIEVFIWDVKSDTFIPMPAKYLIVAVFPFVFQTWPS